MEKDEVLNDWIDSCKGIKNFEASRFYTLFHEGRTKKEIEKIFSFLPKSKALTERMLHLFEPNPPEVTLTSYPLDINRIAIGSVIRYVKEDLKQKKRICHELGENELVQIIDGLGIYYEPKQEVFESLFYEDIPDSWIIEAINDHFSDNLIVNNKKSDGIFEALYGLVVNFQLTWYLGEPLINTEYDSNKYFQIWKGGYDYIIGKDKVYISLRITEQDSTSQIS